MNLPLIFGCGRLEGGLEESNSIALLRSAYSLGINDFDIAPSYGGGQVEEILVKAFGSDLNKINITTKIGLNRGMPISQFRSLAKKVLRPFIRKLKNNSSTILSQNVINSTGRMDINFLESSFFETLERLKLEKIDTLLLHEPRINLIDDKVFIFLNELKEKGLVRRIGTGTGQAPSQAVVFGDVAQFSFQKNSNYSIFPENMELRIHGVFRGNPGHSLEDIYSMLRNSSINNLNYRLIYSTRRNSNLAEVVNFFNSQRG